MNAKKIMGAVLVALLAAALFVGAGAATSVNGQTVFVYEVVTDSNIQGTWANGANTITFERVTGGWAIMGADIVEGTYKKGSDSIIVKYATAAITGKGTYGTSPVINYGVIDGTYYNVTGSSLTIKTSSADGIVVIGADGIPVPMSSPITTLTEGTYKLQAYFKISGGAVTFVETTPADYVYDNTVGSILLGKAAYTITVVDGADPTITAAVDSVVESSTVDVTLTGLPGVVYNISALGFSIPNQAAGADIANVGVVMPNTGKVVVTLKAGSTIGDKTILVAPFNAAGDEAELEIEILEGEITAETDAEAYYIGNDVTITGTSTAGDKVYFYIAGTNVPFQALDSNILNGTIDGSAYEKAVKNGKFKYEIDGDVFNKLDAGTYTVYVAADGLKTAVNQLDTYTTVALVLKQPFISVTDAPSVAVQGTKYKVTGTAEAASSIQYYVFGTNFFGNNSANVKEGSFKIEFTVNAADMDAGQYFMVVQHPMYDEKFNIWVDGTEIKLAETKNGAVDEANATVLFDVKDRQRANAAEALCQALDTENIDDMYVKLSFVVAAPQSVINPIPETVAQGEKLTVSGSTNVGAGEVVTVEMLSTAFAAVPKATVGSASFISLTTKTDENGNWEVTFDTSGLNVDEYTLTAAVEALGSSATAKVNVVEGAPVNPDQPDTPDVPDTPDTPDTPDAPETPGFGALAALAGLGAVAVLLLRRE